MKLIIHSRTSTAASLEFGNRSVISSHALPSMRKTYIIHSVQCGRNITRCKKLWHQSDRLLYCTLLPTLVNICNLNSPWNKNACVAIFPKKDYIWLITLIRLKIGFITKKMRSLCFSSVCSAVLPRNINTNVAFRNDDGSGHAEP